MYKQYKELYIDTTTHTYTMDGVVVPSVTTLIYGHNNFVYTDSVLIGKDIHSLTELAFKERTTDYIKEMVTKYPTKKNLVLRMGEVIQGYNSLYLDSEVILGGNITINGKTNSFAGTIDAIFYDYDKVNNKLNLYIVDWKTGNLNRSIHAKYTLQIHGYILLIKQAIAMGSIDKLLSKLNLTKQDVIIKGLLAYIIGLVPLEDSEDGYKDFKNLLQAYHNNLPGIVWNNGRLKRVALTTKSG